MSILLAELVDDIEMLAPHLDVQAQIAPALHNLYLDTTQEPLAYMGSREWEHARQKL